MTTLYASIIRLHALHPGQLSRDPGQWANAAFYDILNQVDPDLAEALHRWDGRKPFTISSLQGLPRAKGTGIELPAGWECWLRVTTLGEQIFQTFIQSFLQGGARPQIQLGPLSLGISEVLTTPGSHPWAGFANTKGLLEKVEPLERLTLEFASPTVFHLGSGRYELLPLPERVFGALASKWRIIVAPDVDVMGVEAMASRTLISDFRLRTQTLRWRGRVQKGFTGVCTYDLSKLETVERRLLCALSDFAFYAGVGGKTTQGMGQCRRLPIRER